MFGPILPARLDIFLNPIEMHLFRGLKHRVILHDKRCNCNQVMHMMQS